MSSFRVLLADDEAHITHLVAKRLTDAGYAVTVASDGEQAWEAAQEHPPDLVVTDLQMPYMSGLDFAKLLRTFPPTADIPLIMLTARGYVLEPEWIDQARITELHSKPFSVRRLLERVEHLLADRTPRDAQGPAREAA